MMVVNKIKLLEEILPDSRIVEKSFISLPEIFEEKLLSLEVFRDISELILLELINTL